MNARICTACTLHGKGLPKGVSLAMAAVPPGWLNRPGRRTGKGQLATAMQMPALIRKRHAVTRTAFELADQIVAVCAWVKDVLLVNAVPADKILVCRQGLPGDIPVIHPEETAKPQSPGPFSSTRPLRLAFFGRLDPTKGIQVVIEALRKRPELPVVLDIFGVAQGDGGQRYREYLERLAGGDGRTRFCDLVESAAVSRKMREYDLVVIPSQGLETGPLVVYEAFAAEVPVLGSRLGGIAELVTDGKNGRLLPANDCQAWAVELARLVTRPDMVRQWKKALPHPRTMGDVAEETAGFYEKLFTQEKISLRQ